SLLLADDKPTDNSPNSITKDILENPNKPSTILLEGLHMIENPCSPHLPTSVQARERFRQFTRSGARCSAPARPGRLPLAILLVLTGPIWKLPAQAVAPRGCVESDIQRGDRDYSKPASRLGGRWANLDMATSVASCRYYGPIDRKSGTGLYVSYF